MGDGERKEIKEETGHFKGVKTVKIVEASVKFKIPVVTLCISTENWKGEI